MLRQSSVNTSPSTMTSTGASNANSMLRGSAAGSQRVRQVRAIEKRRKIAQQAEASDGPPANDIRSGRRWCDAFGAIIILPPVNLLLLKVRKRQRRRSNSVSSSARSGKRAAVEPRQANQHAENISQLTQALEAAIGGDGDVRREAHAQQIGEVELAAMRASGAGRRRRAAARRESLRRRARRRDR